MPAPRHPQSPGLAAAIAILAAASGPPTAAEENPPAPTSPPPAAKEADAGSVAVIHTSAGPIRVTLDPKVAPASTTNFLRCAREGYYDGTLIHRVVAGFIVQGGGFEPGEDMPTQKDPGPTVPDESANGLKNLRGTIAVARPPDQPDGGAAQFFFNLADNPHLDYQPATEANPGTPGYTVFGKVTDGLETLETIATAPVSVHPIRAISRSGFRIPSPAEHVPDSPIIIESIRVEEVDEDEAGDPAADGKEAPAQGDAP